MRNLSLCLLRRARKFWVRDVMWIAVLRWPPHRWSSMLHWFLPLVRRAEAVNKCSLLFGIG